MSRRAGCRRAANPGPLFGTKSYPLGSSIFGGIETQLASNDQEPDLVGYTDTGSWRRRDR